ncbi:MAG: response regulator transcription factor [Thermomonas sp.]|uniref:response regulator transcription factor n=1 Tax=Thermomonas sp. TaxID=1971895 RepID=UPI0039E47959
MRVPASLAVVEDNPELLGDLVEYLRLRGFSARGFASAEDFFLHWPGTRFDLLLLDVALPGSSGLDIARRVRTQGSGVGIILLTVLDANQDHALGLDAGADVFLSKRSSLEVIEAACRSLLRRLDTAPATNATDAAPQWRLHLRRWQLQTPDEQLLDVTHSEAELLAALMQHPGQTIARQALLARLGKAETLSSLRNLDNTVSRLKRKVQAACGQELPLRPSYGRGYTFAGSGGVTS